MLCEANDIPYNFEVVDALKGQNRKPAFRKEFPSGQVPVIKDGDFRLFETPAILAYICGKYKVTNTWYPMDDLTKRAQVDAWMHWHHAHSRIATKMVLHAKLFPTLPGQSEKWTQGNKQLKHVLAHLEDTLSSRPFLTGDDVTIADLLIVAEFDQHRQEVTGLVDFAPYPNVTRWLHSFDEFPWYSKIFTILQEARSQLKIEK
jgi:glutathione S-transferase